MAKIKPGAIGTLIGRLGNASYYDSPLGPIVRIRNKPKVPLLTNPCSVSQQRFNLITVLWSKLTISQGKAWNELAHSITYQDRVGNIIRKRGRDVFKTVNRYRLNIELPCIFDPPQKIYPQAITYFDVDIYGTDKLDDIKIHFEPPIDKDTVINIYATSSHSSGVTFVKPCWYRMIGFIDYKFKSGDSILEMYNKRFQGHYYRNSRIGFKLKPISVISGFPGNTISVLETAINSEYPLSNT
jgi:hypothetical protein